MKRKNRVVAILLCVFVLLFMLLSSSFIAQQDSHDCIGEGCEICVQIEKTQETLKKLVHTVSAIGLVVAATYLIQKVLRYVLELVRQNTPFLLKVKLLN